MSEYSIDNVDIKEFARIYSTVYVALYESDMLVSYDAAVEMAEYLVKHNAGYKRLVRKFYEHTLDVPTSDRELAAFVMTVRAYGMLTERSAA